MLRAEMGSVLTGLKCGDKGRLAEQDELQWLGNSKGRLRCHFSGRDHGRHSTKCSRYVG